MTKPTVEILAADKAFQAQNCGRWTLLAAGADSVEVQAATTDTTIAAAVVIITLARVVKALASQADDSAIEKLKEVVRTMTLPTLKNESQRKSAERANRRFRAYIGPKISDRDALGRKRSS